jgi:ceramide glucosyltransferase
MTLPIYLTLFCLTACAIHFASLGIALVRCRARRPQARERTATPAVSIVRPVCGIDNHVEETLRSSFTLDYPNYEVIFCVAFARDPVVPLVRHMIASHPHVPARLLVGEDKINQNPKLNNCAKGWRAASYGLIVLADSNVLMPPDYIQRLLESWRADTGLVCSPAVGCAPAGVWAELECAFLNTYQARWQYVADSLGSGFAQGKTMFWCRDVLERAGGIRALGTEIAEDAAATKVVRKAGLRVRLVDAPFGQPLGRRSATEVWRRQVRWARMRRATFPAHFMPEILAGSLLPLTAAGVAATAAELPAAGVVTGLACLWYLAEAALARAAGWHLTWRSPFLWMLRDLLLPVLWVSGWFDRFEWRGHRMQVAQPGKAA